jgi:hypothetical protein
VVPPFFEAYVRVFHRASVGGRGGRPVTRIEIAKANGRVSHSEMRFHALVPEGHIDRGKPAARSVERLRRPPEEGSLDAEIIERLLPILRRHTRPADRCGFAFWDGWGLPVPLIRAKGLFSRRLGQTEEHVRRSADERDRRRAPKFSIPARDLLLFRGSIDHAFL